MTQDFRFELTDAQKSALKDLARLSIASKLLPEDEIDLPKCPDDMLRQTLGAFVTLEKQGQLRGCIGNVLGERPLWDTIRDMACSAAFEDPRFPPVQAAEFEHLDIEISVLSPLEECPDAESVEVGRHGLLIHHRGRSGLLLPQVPVAWNWDRETFLSQTCAKAGLEADAWREPSATLYWFEAVVF